MEPIFTRNMTTKAESKIWIKLMTLCKMTSFLLLHACRPIDLVGG